ncbi:MAG: hypothetical protein CL862_00975 [Cyanobium sp. NAT70]|nr:hypothetical protein [Cyanobium sp. NAT70]|tara:strand:+ start:27 stop:518 length:492 start_codon:yes stop_codon:yes gene_type:complete
MQLFNGDCLEELRELPSESVDSVVTDPPYGLAFMGKDWDKFKSTKQTKSQVVKGLGAGMRMTTADENKNFQQFCEDWAAECFRVLKPGGYLLAFGGSRLYHRLAAGVEDAGFEIRDQIMWVYAQANRTRVNFIILSMQYCIDKIERFLILRSLNAFRCLARRS